jgi:glycosyltransferase involved in cell wall biosynthesis
VDGHSEDGTDEIIKAYANRWKNVKLFYEDRGTMGYARNVGIINARGDIVVFTDADAFCPEDWIKRIVIEFEKDKSVVAVGGIDILFSEDKNASNEVSSIINSWKKLKRLRGVKAAACIKTVNFAVRRDVALSINGFDCGLSHHDETEFIARLIVHAKTESIVYDPTIVVYHIVGKTNLKNRARKVLIKSMASAYVLFRKEVLRIALANPLSSIGTSLLIALACFTVPLSLIATYSVGRLLEGFIFFLLSYLVCLLSYTSLTVIRTRKFHMGIMSIVTFDVTFRFVGTLIGILKWIAHCIVTVLTPKSKHINERLNIHKNILPRTE